MNPVLRAAVIYLVLLVLMRLSGRRTFAEMTPFDFVLVLMVSEATQQALIGEDYSLTNAAIVIATLVGVDVLLAIIKQRSHLAERLIDGLPIVLVEDGVMHKDRMEKARIDQEDILQQARSSQGLESMDDIRYVVLERSGGMSVIPKR